MYKHIKSLILKIVKKVKSVLGAHICKVSIIVPVYDPGPGIKHCIESLQNQTLKDIEILIIDDCSSDDSVKVIESWMAQDDRVLLVFTTSYEDYAIAGYDVGAFAYLLKPLAPDKVFQTLSKAAGTMKRNPSDAWILHSEGENIRIYPSEIRYIEVQGHTLSFHMREEIIHCRARLADIERNLPRPPFSRSHRSYLVNLAYVDKIGKEGLRIGRNLIPVSRNCWEALNRDYLEFYRNR